jgi:transposase-like protein
MEPRLETLQEAIVYFSHPVNCREYVAVRRWPDGVICPRCGSRKVKFLEKYNRWQCGARHKNRQFTAKTGTIFEDSPLGLDKWLAAMWQVVNCKNGVSSYEVHRAIGVTQKTAWFMDHRIRQALQSGSLTKIGGSGTEVEVDETFIGGKARNMHRAKRERLSRDGGLQGGSGKAVVVGMLERGGKVKTAVLAHRRQSGPERLVREMVEPGTEVHTDEFVGYRNLKDGYIHKVINHLEGYVKENVHTNGIENFWSLLKRGLNGTYIAVEPFHLFRYVDEQVFRYNHRKHMDDGQRFDLAVRQIVGKRLTWNQLTGKEIQPTTPHF